MDPLPGEVTERPGLRERKKAKTRALIQAEALRLFRERGYDETSIEDIAEAAEVSPSTVFRYFPTKPDLVIYDDLDDRMLEAYRAQPSNLSAIQAARASLVSTFRSLAGEDLEVQLDRFALVMTVPELRSAMIDEFVRTLREIADMIAERSGRSADDDEVAALAGAVIGIALAAWYPVEEADFLERFLKRFDLGLARLESGFHL